MKWTLITVFICLFFSGCKTQEEIAQKQMVENLNLQVSESQKLSAESTTRMQQLEERLNSITGQVEQSGHENRTTTAKQITDLTAKITVLEENNKTLNDDVENIKISLVEQKKYLEKVLSSLTKISGSGSKSKKGKKLSSYDKAIKDYKRGRYKSAKAQFQTLLSKKLVKGSKKARVLHNLGMCSYLLKQDDQALIYFPKLFSEFPKSNYNKNGLLFLGKTFTRMKKKEEAKQTLTELISRYPKAKQVSEAKKILKKL